MREKWKPVHMANDGTGSEETRQEKARRTLREVFTTSTQTDRRALRTLYHCFPKLEGGVPAVLDLTTDEVSNLKIIKAGQPYSPLWRFVNKVTGEEFIPPQVGQKTIEALQSKLAELGVQLEIEDQTAHLRKTE